MSEGEEEVEELGEGGGGGGRRGGRCIGARVWGRSEMGTTTGEGNKKEEGGLARADHYVSKVERGAKKIEFSVPRRLSLLPRKGA